MTMSSSSRRPKTLVLSVSFTMSASSSCLQTPQKIALRSHYIIQFWVCVNCYAHFFLLKAICYAMNEWTKRYERSEEVNNNFLFKARDGPTQSSPLIGKYCGNAIFPTIHSSGSSLWFKYVTAAEGRTFGRNYDLFYTSTDQGMGCGGTLYNTRGVVTSPNFPQAYAQLSNCQWTLKVPPGQKIELRFTRKEKILRHFFSGFASSAALRRRCCRMQRYC